MQLTNGTPFPAEIFRTVIDQERFAASVFVRVTFDVRDGGLAPSAEQPWRVSGPPWDTPYGPMDSDEVFYKGGVDAFVFGHARAPGGHPVPRLLVRIAVGQWQRSVLVTGDRVWVRHGGRLVASEPAPFHEMPLGLARAFGGRDDWDGLAVAYPANPDGRGFYREEEHAVGAPLPNVEDPDAPVTAWTDRPVPAGLGACPAQSPLRLGNGLGLDEVGQIVEIRPTLFNAAFPAMIVESAQPGDPVWLDGVCADGPLGFRLPAEAPWVRLTFGDEVIERPLAVDQIGVEPDQRRVFVAYRYPFRYVMHPLQRRACELFAPGGWAPGGPVA